MSELQAVIGKMLAEGDEIDPELAKKAYEAVLPRVAKLIGSERIAINTSVEKSVVMALRVAKLVRQPEVRVELELFPQKYFKHEHIDDLPVLALAARHAIVLREAARSGTSDAMLPAELVERASLVKNRMLALCEYYFEQHPRLHKEVAAIRGGNGYEDLSLDLDRLSTIYEEQHEVLKDDRVKYVAMDKDEARTLAQRIQLELGKAQDAEEKQQGAILAGIWTLLDQCYGSIQAIGHIVFEDDEPEDKFPPLRVRKSRKRRKPPAGGSAGSAGSAAQ